VNLDAWGWGSGAAKYSGKTNTLKEIFACHAFAIEGE
jgi:hypothetical protein